MTLVTLRFMMIEEPVRQKAKKTKKVGMLMLKTGIQTRTMTMTMTLKTMTPKTRTIAMTLGTGVILMDPAPRPTERCPQEY